MANPLGFVAVAASLVIVAIGAGLALTEGARAPAPTPEEKALRAAANLPIADVFRGWRPPAAGRLVEGRAITPLRVEPKVDNSESAATALRVALERPNEGERPQRLRARAPGESVLAYAPTPGTASDFGPGPFGGLNPDLFFAHRLTVLQIGDSHTAADFFTGRVRERLQSVFGSGGAAYVVPGRPHPGVRSNLFDATASDGWNYELLQKSDDVKRFYLTGFNAATRKSGAALDFKPRTAIGYDAVEVSFLKQPGGGKAQVLVDGAVQSEVNLEASQLERTVVAVKSAAGPGGVHQITVRSVGDAPVVVTGVDAERSGDGVSYIAMGFPGATVQLLQKLNSDNLADDMKRIAPDLVVLAFGTNEGFNDNLDVALYASQYEQIVKKMRSMRPSVRFVLVGPPDAARPQGVCKNSGVGHDCPPPAAAPSAACKFETPPKLNAVRIAIRKIAEKLGTEYWDWSSAQPRPCGAQVWAAANPPLMAHDYVHMTLEGYKQSADKFADFLIPLIGARQSQGNALSYN